MGSFSIFVHMLVVVCFALLLGWAAYSDATRLIIPNAVSAAILCLFPVYVLASSVPIDWSGHIVVGTAVFALGFLFFAFGSVGGGDVKLFTVTALWAGPVAVLPFLAIVGIGGGVISLVTLTRLRVFRLRPSVGPSHSPGLSVAMRTHVPYGVAIAVGGLFVASRMLGA